MSASRRTFIKTTTAAGTMAMLPQILRGEKNDLKDKKNILFIGVDDLNDWIGCLGGHPQAKTPHIDRLAAQGTLFANAYCQAPLCTPSRNSLLTGLRPTTMGSYGLKPGIRDIARTKHHVTLPQTYTAAGYHTYTCGKVYHDHSIKPKDRAKEFNTWGPAPSARRPRSPIADLPATRHPAMDWGPYPERDDEQCDYMTASSAIDALAGAPQDKPFFVGCGFRMPHVPCLVPQKWFDLYPEDTLQMPPVLENDRANTPRFSWYLHWKLTEPRLKMLKDRGEWKPLVRAYLACVSYLDHQVGRVLAALEATGRADDTIVVFWADHGWHLGEKAISGKNTLWERATHIPLIFSGPGITAGARCTRTVESLDIFPTLLELTEFPKRNDLEGHSLGPLCRDASAARPWPAVTTHNQGNHAVRTERWRYIRYADGSDELYDMANDPHEWKNLAGQTKYESLKNELAAWMPKHELPPAPGSEKRILTYDSTTGIATWEGQPIGPNDPVPQGLYSYP